MNFTRDPIIETVITPREGCKLVVRSSKGAKQEEYLVDAIEVVSFGHSFFYRSIERPKSFLVPLSDYEIFEAKELKLSIKNAPLDRSIKIGGGKEAPKQVDEDSQEKKPRKKKSRKSKERTDTSKEERAQSTGEEAEGRESLPSSKLVNPEQVSPPLFISKLFPPPSTLIKETLGRYKEEELPIEKLILPETLEEPQEIKIEEDLSKEDEQ